MKICRLLSLFLLACGGFGGYGGDFGATPGGVKDMGLARELLANGQIPPPDALLVEAMFSEHDLGIPGGPCARTLCLRAASGIAPDAAGTSVGWVQVGMASSIDPTTWQRPSTTFVMTVDVSGSMGWEYVDGEYPSPGQLARELLTRLGGVMTEADRVAIVTYGSDVAVPLALTRGDDSRYLAAVDELGTAGSTNMEAGLRRAYQIAADAAAGGETEQVRVLLFTDVQPNVGATSASEFEEIVAGGADDAGITVVALGLGIGPEVTRGIAHLTGANAFSLFQSGDVGDFMADEWPWFTTPIAYDLDVAVTPSSGLAVGDLYGFPSGGEPGLDVATVFLSKKKGALLLTLEGEDLSAMRADLALRYRTPEGTIVDETLATWYAGEPLDERGQFFQAQATARAAALALVVSGMHAAAEAYGEDPAGAEAIMRAAHERFAADAAALADPTLDVEVALSRRMLDLVVARAPQGTLYGQ